MRWPLRRMNFIFYLVSRLRRAVRSDPSRDHFGSFVQRECSVGHRGLAFNRGVDTNVRVLSLVGSVERIERVVSSSPQLLLFDPTDDADALLELHRSDAVFEVDGAVVLKDSLGRPQVLSTFRSVPFPVYKRPLCVSPVAAGAELGQYARSEPDPRADEDRVEDCYPVRADEEAEDYPDHETQRGTAPDG
jgi:hypothetical protein